MASNRRKNSTINNNAMKEQNIQGSPLTDKELYEFIENTMEIMNAYGGSNAGYPSAFTPLLTNERLKEISFTPEEITPSILKKIMADPAGKSELASAYAQWLQFSEAITKRTTSYLGNLLPFDYTFICTNAPKNRNDEDYIKDKEIVKDFLSRFNVRAEFSKVHRITVLKDAYFGIFRMDTGNNYSFQELPSNYCLITGRNADYGFLYDFDMTWFLRQGLPIDDYPLAMKKLWHNVFDDTEFRDYDPSSYLDDRNGSFSTWGQTSPLIKDGGFVCFKFNSDTTAIVPFVASLFNDAVLKNLKRELQNNQDIIASQKILIGLIPLLKNQKSGEVKDAVSMTPNLLRQYLGMLKKGLSDAIKVSGVPFSDVKDINYSLPSKNIYTESNDNMAANSGVTSGLIYTSQKMTAQETLLSSEIDANMAKQAYSQYATWLSSVVNSLTKKYKFKFSFEGVNFTSNRKERLDTALKLADKGIVLKQKIAAAIGLNSFELDEMMASGQEDGFRDNLYLLLNSNTKDYGVEDSDVGRPMTDSPSESTDRNANRVISEKGGV